MSKALKVGIIGLGRMGQCIVTGLLESSQFTSSQVAFTTRHAESSHDLEKSLKITRKKSNLELVKDCDIILLAVKPQNIGEVLTEIGPSLTPEKTLVSIVASISTWEMENKITKKVAVIRAMPNTPAFVGAGITAFCLGKNANSKSAEIAKMIFDPLGSLVAADEKHMDAVTGLSGCGPAYIYMVLESLTDGGIKVGLPRDLATKLAAHTVLGAAKMLIETGKHPAALKDEVTTPAGCTIDGLMELEDGKLRVTLIKAVVQATKRAKSLAKLAKL